MPTPVRNQTAAIASGDSAALAEFYQQWFGLVFQEARRLSQRDEAFCLDMVQETMLRVIRSIKPLESNSAVAQWLRTAVRSCCVDQLRKELRQAKRDKTRGIANLDAEQIEQDRNERIAWLGTELQRMDPAHSTLLRLRFGYQWTLQRIGTAMGLQAGAVDGRIRRVLAELRAKAAEELHD